MDIPFLLLEEINAGEKNACDYYKIYGKDNIDNELSFLKKSDAEFFSKYPSDRIRNDVICKLKSNKHSESKKKLSLISRYIIPACAAAVFCCVAIFPLYIKNQNTQGNVLVDNIRVKGLLQGKERLNAKKGLQVYQLKNTDIVQLKNGQKVHEGDVLQLEYFGANDTYGVIFSIDGNGAVSRHFPENDWVSGELKKNKGYVPLDFSYELDNAPDFECFVFVSSKEKFKLENIEKIGEEINKIEKTEKKLDMIKAGEYLPENTESSVFIVNK